MPGPADWYDGNGDPFEAPKYLRAREALERGVSPELRDKLEAAIGEYELIHTPAAPNGEDVPDPPSQREGDEPPAAPSSSENPLAPDYYDAHPMPTATATPRRPALLSRPSSAPSGDSAFAIGARNPWDLGDEAVGLGASISRVMPSWLGGSGGTTQQRGRAFVQPEDESQDVSVYPIARDEERANQAWAQRTSPGMYNLGKGSVETLATAPLMLTGVGEGALAARLGAAGAQQLAARAAAPAVSEIIGAGGLQGMAGGALQAAGESRAPTASGVAEDLARGGMYGGTAGALTSGALATAPRGAVAAVPLGIAGATYGAVESEDPSLSGRALNAAKYGLGAGVGGSALIGAVAPNVSRQALEAFADNSAAAVPRGTAWLAKLGNRAAQLRAGASGAYGAEVDKVAKNMRLPPDQAMTKLGNEIERLGIHKRPGSGLLSRLPSTPAVYAKNAERVADTAGREVGATLREAGEQGVGYPKADLVRTTRRLAARSGNNTDAEITRGRTLRTLANRIDAKPGDQTAGHALSPQRLWNLKKSYEKAGGYRGDRNAPLSAAVKSETHRAAASIPRRALYSAMREQAYRGTPVNALGPGEQGTLQRFEGAMQDYGPANTIKNLAEKRVAHGMGNNPVPLTAGAAASHGGLTGLAVHGFNNIGRDVGANALRAVEGVARTPPVPSPIMFPLLAGSAAAQGSAPMRSPAPPAQPQPPAQAPTPPPAARPTPRDPNYATPQDNGLHLPEKLREAVLSNPDALGSQSQSLQDAFASGDETEVTAAIAKAMEDPDFRTRVLPTLQ